MLIARASYRSQDAVVDLSRKFGCALECWPTSTRRFYPKPQVVVVEDLAAPQ